MDEKLPCLKEDLVGVFSNILYFGLDIRECKKIKALFDKLKVFPCKELVVLAGVNILEEALNISEEMWDMIIDTNLKGCFFIMREAAKNMIYHDINGSIVNIASQHGHVGNLNRAAYCASKAAVLNLNRVLALEWATFGIRVNSISPTWITYSHNKDLLNDNEFKKKNLYKIPLRKYCTSTDIVNAIEYLLSDKSRMMTGQSIILDGGWTIK